jgi:KipI family sensor histidine kinase inhibitor
MKLRAYGERAVLCEVPDHTQVPGLRAAAAALDGVAEVVAGAQTLLVVAVEGANLTGVGDALTRLQADEVAGSGAREVTLDVVYDGPDLDDMAHLVGLSADEVVAAHTRAEYVVRFCGFAPGFAYLDGLDERLHVPRRSEPRTRIPAGAVAVAGEFAGVYPRASPGGWRLLGRTDAVLWDVGRDPPALLAPGTLVRFRAT